MDALDWSGWAAPALALCALAMVSWWYQHSRGWRSWPVIWKTVLGSLVAARITFVLQNAGDYLAAPLSIADLGDGGFSDAAGILTALALGLHLTARSGTPRRPVLAAFLAGAVAWTGGAIATASLGPRSTPLPLVALKRLDGTPVRLHDLAGKPMVVNLWATWCPPCRREMPALEEAQRRYPGIRFLFINQGEDAATIQAFMAQQQLGMANVFTDRARQAGRRTGSFAMPTTLFYDKDGRLVLRHMGELDRDGLDRRLEKLMTGSAGQR
ncbi:TlpA family protein disulfide reductase [Massilia oculi]|uniref:TlpA family protein disulfide reductase n=1 Tax=Massilia hydrophila TaxID=3044279 RepID=A0ABS7YCP6_9BURK|nr:TlpA family protein disulfide reductase [Massilia oculi]